MTKEFGLFQEHSRVISQNHDPHSAERVDFRERHAGNIKNLTGNPFPELSVVVPAFNEGGRVERLLASLDYALSVTRTPTEIIVVDNASTDQTAEIARDFGVTVVREPLKGIAAARQAGLEATRPTSAYVLTTDADSLVSPDWINRHHRSLSDPGVSFTYGDVNFCVDQEVGDLDRTLFKVFLIGRGAFRGAKRLLIKDFAPVAGVNSGFRREEAFEAGGYRRELAALEDFCFLLDIQKKTGGRAQRVDAPVLTSARRILGYGVTNYMISRLDFNRNYYVQGNLDQPIAYSDLR